MVWEPRAAEAEYQPILLFWLVVLDSCSSLGLGTLRDCYSVTGVWEPRAADFEGSTLVWALCAGLLSDFCCLGIADTCFAFHAVWALRVCCGGSVVWEPRAADSEGCTIV